MPDYDGLVWMIAGDPGQSRVVCLNWWESPGGYRVQGNRWFTSETEAERSAKFADALVGMIDMKLNTWDQVTAAVEQYRHYVGEPWED